MKKLLSIIAVIVLAITLVACNEKEEVTSPVVISKVYTATRLANNVLELYNNSDADIELTGYKINFYTNGAEEVSSSIDLTGTIKANDYYAIGANGHANQEVKDKLDLKTPGSLPFNGNDAIELNYNGTVIDFIGYKGIDIEFSKNLTMIRLGNKEEYKPSKEYQVFSYIYYLPELFEYLKNDNHEIKTLDQILEGPKLDQRYKDTPYIDPINTSMGAGGAALVKLSGVSDGDTATFLPGNGFPGGNSMRYYYLNTPEVNGSNVVAEPWGYVASKYNKQYLLKDSTSKEIYVQSIKGVSVTENYGRYLGLVWVNGALSQFLIVSEGLTESVGQTYTEADLQMNYKNIPYLTFLRFAENRAEVNGWGVHGYPTNPNGEKSPDWNYQANNGVGSLATTDPVWTPHLPLPWEK